MVAILVPQPDDTTGDRGLAPAPAVPLRRVPPPALGLSTSRVSSPFIPSQCRERCPIARRVSGAGGWPPCS